ncbi:tRNA pseudouridine(55) synthase TruB [Alginatibacterium sediminis]|uniref:tRNA pseudouridine synthase B n=1 Tax=Alginatibacterium sediminis TaxID=2164068 RepID=A0A420E874_9ALTE|nr:tRNA pseudouridine(55) synthase TruB [Alginatibacterium sediminis]RKF15580.1 tRNA pseudouridine(55) synthase TruB [Alginatibacterium sediminis]
MARTRKGRAINGIFLLDKPTDMSSNHALQHVKRIFGAAKAGHTGALDPLATGMLPICLGEATKFSQFLLDSDKQYQVRAKLGQRTDTSDSDGEIVQERAVDVNLDKIESALAAFRGPILQVPSMYSALKHQGKPLYTYARAGIEVEREARPITVFSLELVSLEDDLLTLNVHCSKGTYVRTIVDDLGEALGCGAHVVMLHRTQVSKYPVDKMMSLDQLRSFVDQAKADERSVYPDIDPLLLPMDTAVHNLPSVAVDLESANYLLHGNPVQGSGAPLNQQFKLIAGPSEIFIGVGEVNDDGLVAPKRMINGIDLTQ